MPRQPRDGKKHRCTRCKKQKVGAIRFKKRWWCRECLTADDDNTMTQQGLWGKDSNLGEWV